MFAVRVARMSALAIVPIAGTLLLAGTAGAAQPPVSLGTADSFAVLAGAGITNTGPTTITGDVGTFPTKSQTGFGSVTLIGTNHAGDAVTQEAKTDLVTAYNDAAGRTPATSTAVELGGRTLEAGVYQGGTFGLTGTLTLDAKGVTSAQFIFQAASTVIAESNSRVRLLNGARACNVVWKVGSSATFKTGTRFVGDVLALTSITAQTRAAFQGRLLARNGAVTLDTNTISNASCASVVPGGTPTPTPGGGVSPTATPGGVTPTATPGDGGNVTPTPTPATGAGPSTTPGPITPAGLVPPGTTPTPNVDNPDTTPPVTRLRPGTPGFVPVTGAATGGLLALGIGMVALGVMAVVGGRHHKSA